MKVPEPRAGPAGPRPAAARRVMSLYYICDPIMARSAPDQASFKVEFSESAGPSLARPGTVSPGPVSESMALRLELELASEPGAE